MNAFVQTLYQFVWSTKYRSPTLRMEDYDILEKYIGGILNKKRCHCYAVGGIEDHIHIVGHVHQTVAVADLVKDIKLATHQHIEKLGICPHFEAWQQGYAALTYHISAKDTLVAYTNNQEAHHADTLGYRQELMQLLDDHLVDYDGNYLD